MSWTLPCRRVDLEPPIPRYVLPFRIRSLPALRTPVLVVGAGAAGAAAALAAAAGGREVLVLTKPPRGESNTRWAQGGIAAAVSEEDSAERHAEDTIAVGCGLCEEEVVRAIVGRGPEVVSWLEAIGVRFDRRNGPASALTREGGHSMPRVLSSGGDATGRAIQRALSESVAGEPAIDVRDELRAVDLLVAEGRCLGALAVDPHGNLLLVLAGTTILATGATGQLFRETTNPAVATGDGLGLAFRAGASLADLEFVQFHPTTLYIAGAARVLISEAVRGAGARLIDRNGDPVMEGVHPDGDLAPRDVVARAILQRMVEIRDTNVYLDASHIEGVKERFPQIARMCAAFGIDIASDPIPVRPGAHYMIGGVRTDLEGRTDLPGLLAAGEVAATGLHGANRLASNSLLEALVVGRAAGALAAQDSEPPEAGRLRGLDGDPEHWNATPSPADLPLNFDDMLYSLKSLMWRQAGLVREGWQLAEGLAKIRFWLRVLRSRPGPRAPYLDLYSLLQAGELVCACALAREESRGTHFRSDHPASEPAWRRHSLVRRVD